MQSKFYVLWADHAGYLSSIGLFDDGHFFVCRVATHTILGAVEYLNHPNNRDSSGRLLPVERY